MEGVCGRKEEKKRVVQRVMCVCCVIGIQSVCYCFVLVCVCVCMCVYIHLFTLIGMGSAGELAQDAVSDRRGKYASSANVTWCGITGLCVCVRVCVCACVRAYIFKINP